MLLCVGRVEMLNLGLAEGHELGRKLLTREPEVVPAADAISNAEAAVRDVEGVFAVLASLATRVPSADDS